MLTHPLDKECVKTVKWKYYNKYTTSSVLPRKYEHSENASEVEM